MTVKSYLLRSVALFDKDSEGADTRKAAIEAERAKVQVTKVDIKDENDEGDKEEVEEAKEGEEEAKDDDGEEEKEGDEEKEETSDEDKEELKASDKLKRLERKIARETEKRVQLARENKALKAKLEAKPEKVLTEDDVESRSEEKAKTKQRLKEFNATVDRLADAAQTHLKMKPKEFDALVEDVTEDLGSVPAQIIDVLGELDNGGAVLAHLLKNVDEAESMYGLKDKEAKLGVALAKLSLKLAKPTTKQISKVPDAVEPLGGKSAGGDRLAILAAKKNLTREEMDEYVQARNAEVNQKRKNGRVNLR